MILRIIMRKCNGTMQFVQNIVIYSPDNLIQTKFTCDLNFLINLYLNASLIKLVIKMNGQLIHLNYNLFISYRTFRNEGTEKNDFLVIFRTYKPPRSLPKSDLYFWLTDLLFDILNQFFLPKPTWQNVQIFDSKKCSDRWCFFVSMFRHFEWLIFHFLCAVFFTLNLN